MKTGELDRAINSPKLANAAAIFGGNSASHLAAVAAIRVSLMENERAMLESMKLPRTLESLAAMEVALEQLRATRRNLDSVQAQRSIRSASVLLEGLSPHGSRLAGRPALPPG